MRILGIDFGDSRTGIAISDPLGWTAQGLETARGGMTAAAERIAQLTRYYGVKTIVVGYPLNMDGSAGFRAERTDCFISVLINQIGKETVEILKWDERLTSAEAARVLRATGAKPGSRPMREKGKIDVVAAAILLQSYLDSIKLNDGGISEGEQSKV